MSETLPEGRNWDVIVSFVLYRTPVAEVERAVAQVLGARRSTHVVIVDNSVPPMALPDFDPERVTIIQRGENVGYGRGHNRAIAASRGRSPYHIVMNSDVTYESTVIDHLFDFMEAHPNAGLSMPKARYPDGRLQHLCRLLPTPLDLLGRGFMRSSRWAKKRSERYEFHKWSYDQVASFPFLSGCFMMLRRTVLEAVGGFDERFFVYGEDVDLSRRIHRVADTLFVPTAEITHDYRSESAPSRRLLYLRARGLTKYFNKWGWAFDHEREAFNRRAVQRIERQRT